MRTALLCVGTPFAKISGGAAQVRVDSSYFAVVKKREGGLYRAVTRPKSESEES